MNRPFLFVAAFLACSALASAEAQPITAPVPVVDLRVGLSHSISRDRSLARGFGQAGFVQLAQGNVVGALVPLPGGAAPPFETALSAYLALNGAFDFSQKFSRSGCRPSAGRIGTWFELETPDLLAREPTSIALWATRGVRVFAIASERDNELGTAATAISPGPVTGLTRVGREVVARILAEGGIVDVSGASELTISDVIELAMARHAPVVATHSNARALADQPRNLSDATIRAIAQTGGVIGVTAAHGLLAPGLRPTLDHLVRQITHLVRVAGAEHVALGLGFELGAGTLRDFSGARDLPRLATALRRAGLAPTDITRVFSSNALRLLCAETVNGRSP